jgi:hypothetical protein
MGQKGKQGTKRLINNALCLFVPYFEEDKKNWASLCAWLLKGPNLMASTII